jgi:translation initiation factor 2 beta subunit (eIF-2beta)/eIF-5
LKAKTIKAILTKKHNDFVASIQDEEVQKLVDKNSIITGGSIVSMLLGEPVNDFDYYFTDKETVLAVANYYVNKFNELNPDKNPKPVVVETENRVRIRIQSMGIASEGQKSEYKYFEMVDPSEGTNFVDEVTEVLEKEQEAKQSYRPIFLSDNAITLSGKIQLVIRFYGETEEIHDNYDFVHAMCYWRSENNHLDLPARSLEAILTRELVYHGSKYPLASVIRTRKFIQRGWTINAGQYLKMCLQINELDLKNVDVLEEQLTGMDVAYFVQVLSLIRKRMDEDEDFKLTSAYLIEVINRIF